MITRILFMAYCICVNIFVYAQEPIIIPSIDASVNTSSVNTVIIESHESTPAVIIAPNTAPTDINGFKVDEYSDPTNLLDLFEKAVTTRNYMMGAGVLLFIAIWIIRKNFNKVPPKLIPAMGIVLASLPALALTLLRPGTDKAMVWKSVIIIATMSGGAWETIGKYILEEWIPKFIDWFKSYINKITNKTAVVEEVKIVPVIKDETKAVETK